MIWVVVVLCLTVVGQSTLLAFFAVKAMGERSQLMSAAMARNPVEYRRNEQASKPETWTERAKRQIEGMGDDLEMDSEVRRQVVGLDGLG